MNKKYSEGEKRWIIENAGKKTDEEAVKEFNGITGKSVSLSAYRRLRNRLGIKKVCGRGKCEVRTNNV